MFRAASANAQLAMHFTPASTRPEISKPLARRAAASADEEN
jgi:hypothetical protein